MSSLQFKGFGGCTIHRWCGVGDCSSSKEDMCSKISTEAFDTQRKQVSEADVLLIDEIGMISRKAFDLIEFTCRKIRKSTLVFGVL